MKMPTEMKSTIQRTVNLMVKVALTAAASLVSAVPFVLISTNVTTLHVVITKNVPMFLVAIIALLSPKILKRSLHVQLDTLANSPAALTLMNVQVLTLVETTRHVTISLVLIHAHVTPVTLLSVTFVSMSMNVWTVHVKMLLAPIQLDLSNVLAMKISSVSQAIQMYASLVTPTIATMGQTVDALTIALQMVADVQAAGN